MAEKAPVSVQINEKPIKRRRLKVGDPDFRAPDGGWGWLIIFACGFSNLSTFPMFQQFGLVFRSKYEQLGISTSQTTTVINMNSAFNASMGLLNGPLFRRFTYRQVAMFGSCLVASSLFISTFCNDFWSYMIFYAACYGSGIGITQSSNALALNTYFKEKRRIATGFSWTTTALGPIVWPYIIVALNEVYGMEGTLLLFSGFALHAFVCSLLLHPVEWHTKFKEIKPEAEKLLEQTKETHENGELHKKIKRKNKIYLTQYMNHKEDPINHMVPSDPGTPMMVHSNDGWYSQMGSRMSLASVKSKKYPSGQNSSTMSTRPSYSNLTDSKKEQRERKRKLSHHNKPPIMEGVEENHDNNTLKPPESYPDMPNEKEVLKSAAKKLKEYEMEVINKDDENDAKEEENPPKKLSIWKKIAIFFDFDLFRDPIYLNLMLGITVANFAELNFSILTPMVLKEFNFGKYETATFMSLLGAADIVSRFCMPFVADRIGWSNRIFFLIGVMSMALGRIILVHTQTYAMSLVVAIIIGAGKGLRTIFMALVIPSYVPLERLAAASGLQLATSGLLFILLGPVVGWIREAVHNYVITLHLLNICTYVTVVAWTIEWIIKKGRKQVKKNSTETTATVAA